VPPTPTFHARFALQWDQAIDHVTTHLLDKSAEFYTLDKLRRAAGVDRCLTLREIIEKGTLTDLNVNPAFNIADFRAVPKEWRDKIPAYVKDYVSLIQFM
jgi:hypothetical protein